MPPPKRPKKGLTWMNELLREDELRNSESAHCDSILHDGSANSSVCTSDTSCVADGKPENSITASDLPVSTSMVRSDSMSSTDSLKENKIPQKATKSRNENGERCQVKLKPVGSENMTRQDLPKQPQSTYSGKHPSLCVLLANCHQQVNFKATEMNAFKWQKKPVLEGLPSSRQADLKSGNNKNSQVMASRMPQPMAALDKDHSSYSSPHKSSPAAKHEMLVCRDVTMTVTGTVKSSSHNQHMPSPSGSYQQSVTQKLLLKCGQTPGETSLRETSSQDVINGKDQGHSSPQILPAKAEKSPPADTVITGGQDVNNKVYIDYEEADRANADKPVLFTLDNSDSEADTCNQTGEQDGYKPELAHQQVWSDTGRDQQTSEPSTTLASLLRKHQPQRSASQQLKLPLSQVRPFEDASSADGVASTHPSRHCGTNSSSLESPHHKSHSPIQEVTSLNHCINSIVASVLLSKDEKQQFSGFNKSTKPNVATTTRQITNHLDGHQRQMASPPGELGVNYPMALLKKVLPPGDRVKNAGDTVLSSGEKDDFKPCSDASRSMSCSSEQQSDGIATSPSYQSEKMENSTSVTNNSSVTVDSLQCSVTTSSPLCQSEDHSPNMDITSSTSDITKTPVNSVSTVGDDSKNSTSHLCQVCNDAASGFHYGVWSCEGCKAFFKRSLQGPVNYICPATNSCTIDKHRRKSCQACRLRKCIEMGMSRGNCREKKGPNQRQMKRKSQDSNIKCEMPSKMSSQYPDQSASSKREPQICSVRPLVDPDSRSTSQICPPASARQDQNAVHPLVEHLLKIEPPARLANASNRPQQTADDMATIILELADAELMDVVGWARGIPGYMELPLVERMHLLEYAWMEILILGLVWRSMPHQDVLVFASDLCINRERLSSVELSRLFEQTLTLVNILRQYQLNQEQLVLLRACILLNAGVQNLNNEKYFQGLEDKVHSALHYTTIQRQKHPISHVMKLLLFLVQLRQVSLETIALLSRLQQQNKLPSTLGLIGEILSKQTSFKTQYY